MSTINTTICVDENSAGIVAGLLSRFPKGQRVHLAMTDEISPVAGSNPDLVDWLLSCPEKDWFVAAKESESTDDLQPLTFE